MGDVALGREYKKTAEPEDCSWREVCYQNRVQSDFGKGTYENPKTISEDQKTMDEFASNTWVMYGTDNSRLSRHLASKCDARVPRLETFEP